ncbi:ribosome biogenesis protein C1orf109 homolog [Gadus chalcogrammus]|uniref:ribosome biogenesis protein C1orf109 homolog n=1 Tax=Gadus chalcogrammus TaxID=1042646 RepID=UPI0024C4AFAF|nr:ribosome biogenesis protein C1orf109 homolog [Gadus chalcogrammus]
MSREMSIPSSLALQQVLRKSFQHLETNQKTWHSVLAECTPLVGSVGNLAQQLRALSNVNIPNTPLKAFPDLQQRLHFKLVLALDIVLEKLNEKLVLLQSVRDSHTNQLTAVFQLYERDADTLDLYTCTQRSPVAPSIADMLEWLQNAELYYKQQFLKRKTLLHSLMPDDLSLLESTPERWDSLDTSSGEEYITDTLFRVSFLVESNKGE